MSADIEWWKARATKRYRELTRLRADIQSALDKHADCWPDDPCSELAYDITTALDGKK